MTAIGLGSKQGSKQRRRLFGALMAATTVLACCGQARATDYSEGSIVTAPYVDSDGNTYMSAVETADLSSDPTAPTDIGALTLGSNFITGATIPYGPVANTMTGELLHQDNDYVTFTVPVGDVLASIDLVAPPPAAPPIAPISWSGMTSTPVLDGSAIEPGDLFFVGIASGASVHVTPPSSAGLLGFSLLSASAIGTDILPGLGSLAAPSYFDMPPFLGATTFSGALPAGTYSLWMLDGNDPVSYKFALNVAPVPETTSWAMYIAGFGLLGGILRRRRTPVVRFA